MIVKSSLILIALSFGFAGPAHAYDQDKNPIKITKSNRTKALSPEEQQANV